MLVALLCQRSAAAFVLLLLPLLPPLSCPGLLLSLVGPQLLS